MGRYDSTLKRMQEIVAVGEEFYEVGVQAKCYAAVWRRVIFPRYGIHYYTYLHYVAIVKFGREVRTQREDTNQLKLF